MTKYLANDFKWWVVEMNKILLSFRNLNLFDKCDIWGPNKLHCYHPKILNSK